MDDYDEFDLEGGANLVLKCFLALLVAAGLAIIFTLTFSYEATNKFFEVVAQVVALGIELNYVFVFILNITLTTLVSPVAYIWAQGPEFAGLGLAGVNLEAGLISSLVCYSVAGLVAGLLAKKDWLTGLQAGIIVVGLAYILSLVLMIVSLLLANALFAGIATVITLGLYITLTFVMSLISFAVCGFFGTLGGFLYQKFLKNKYRL